METFNSQAKLFKALMHPGRLAILDVLQDGEQCVCHMEAVLGCRQAYISQHLAVLREAGIVEDRRDGWNIFYRVAKVEVYDLINQAGQLMGQTKADSDLPRKSVDCPCPKCNPEAPLIK